MLIMYVIVNVDARSIRCLVVGVVARLFSKRKVGDDYFLQKFNCYSPLIRSGGFTQKVS